MDSRQTIHSVSGGHHWTEAGFIADRSLEIADGRIVTTGKSQPASAQPGFIDAGDGYVIPGLVDLQVNGALNHSFQAADRGHFDAIVAHHRNRGTTTMLPTLVTAPVDTLIESLDQLCGYLDHAADITLPGIHLEGPFLAPARSGAHDPEALCLPDVESTHKFLDAASGRLSIFTMAPELTGSESVIRVLSKHGVIVSAGHSAASHAEMGAAIGAGLSMVTHAGNASDWPGRAMGPQGFMTSEPGVVGTLLSEPDLSCGIIMDGYHFHPALLAPLLKLKGPDKILLVSDASTVAGCGQGDYVSGGLDVTVHEAGFAVSGRGGGWLAGSTITLLDAVRCAVRLAGIPLEQAVHMATLGPARRLGIADRKGSLAVGNDADLLILDRDLALRHVVVAGIAIY